jgi:MATE family multidrug resistance protein
MVVLVSANLVNVFANWLLIFGHWGLPALGAEGAGWATCVSRLYLAASLFGYILYHDRQYGTGLWHIPLTPNAPRISRLIRVGFPAALQRALELGAFAVITVLAGKLAPAELAAHQIALNVASVTFMIPLGISAAAAVRVGQALGRREPAAARRSGWTALLLASVFMGAAGVAFLLAPRLIVRAFTTDATVIGVGAALLLIAAFFQLFDGIQVVATGALRGAGDTRLPMIANLVGHWILGLPVSYVLCFQAGWGVRGLWMGVSAGLIAVGALLLWVWAQRAEWRLAEKRLAA